MKRDFIFSSESVTEGHPDKLCDRISDALVGQYLRRDPLARVTAECAVSTGILFVAVRLAADATVDVPFVAREVIRDIGYERDGMNTFNARDCTVMTTLSEFDRSPLDGLDESAMSSDDLDRVVARDQVTVFGFACTRTPSFMPLPVWLAQAARRLALARSPHLPELLPDGKTQVSVGVPRPPPVRLHGLTVITTQRDAHADGANRLRDRASRTVIAPAFADEDIVPDQRTRIDINPEVLSPAAARRALGPDGPQDRG
jgi:S-adenosylmethionine synthetase